jgi:hypothetical protein
LLVAGGLMFSATTVYDWTKIAFQSSFKALGFCVLVEGVMTFSGIAILSYAALAVLAIINGIGTGCKIALNQRQYKIALGGRQVTVKPAKRTAPALNSQRPALVRQPASVA